MEIVAPDRSVTGQIGGSRTRLEQDFGMVHVVGHFLKHEIHERLERHELHRSYSCDSSLRAIRVSK